MAVGALGLGYLLVRGTKETAKDVKEISEDVAKKVQNKAINVSKKVAKEYKNTKVSSFDRATYTFASVHRSRVDLLKGESPIDIGKKLVKTHQENFKDVTNGLIPKWALPFTGIVGPLINTLAD